MELRLSILAFLPLDKLVELREATPTLVPDGLWARRAELTNLPAEALHPRYHSFLDPFDRYLKAATFQGELCRYSHLFVPTSKLLERAISQKEPRWVRFFAERALDEPINFQRAFESGVPEIQALALAQHSVPCCALSSPERVPWSPQAATLLNDILGAYPNTALPEVMQFNMAKLAGYFQRDDLLPKLLGEEASTPTYMTTFRRRLLTTFLTYYALREGKYRQPRTWPPSFSMIEAWPDALLVHLEICLPSNRVPEPALGALSQEEQMRTFTEAVALCIRRVRPACLRQLLDCGGTLASTVGPIGLVVDLSSPENYLGVEDLPARARELLPLLEAVHRRARITDLTVTRGALHVLAGDDGRHYAGLLSDSVFTGFALSIGANLRGALPHFPSNDPPCLYPEKLLTFDSRNTFAAQRALWARGPVLPYLHTEVIQQSYRPEGSEFDFNLLQNFNREDGASVSLELVERLEKYGRWKPAEVGTSLVSLKQIKALVDKLGADKISNLAGAIKGAKELQEKYEHYLARLTEKL